MIERAVETDPRFSASDLEMKLGGTSYSIRTVESLRSLFGRGSRFSFIIGADSLYEISSWKEVERLSRLCDFITVARTGYPLEGLSPGTLSIGEALFRRLAGGIIRTPHIDISSTMIRERVRAGRSIEYMVPDAVADYIKRKGLYREGGQESKTR
jgi:nicotinate-nucleotide adenylyltransferase